jgi:hypothetical protein
LVSRAWSSASCAAHGSPPSPTCTPSSAPRRSSRS